MEPSQLATGCQPPGFFDGMNMWEEWVLNFFPRFGDTLCRSMGGASSGGFPDWAIFLILGIAGALIVVNIAALGVPYVVLLERKLLGRFHNRIGPNRVGIFGLAQPLADALKLMTKEDVTPSAADKLMHALAPLVFAIPVVLMFAPIPWADHTVMADLDIGILYIVAVTTAAEVGVFMAGWASNNKYSLFGAMRAVGMLVTYEVPLVLSIAAVALLAGTLNLSEIVRNQEYVPNLLFQPLGFLIFMIAISAELNRAPFDLLEADSELISGFHTEYSGMKWALIQLGEYAAIIGFSAIISTLFLSGWKGPIFLPGYIWIFAKMGFIISGFIWIRATLPRLRVDQIMAFGWKFLLPLAFLNLFVTAAEVIAFPEGLPEWLIPVNMGVAFAAVIGSAKLMKFKAETRQLTFSSAYAPPGEPVGDGVRVVARGG
jgi:NADH-quinone oxidoreductase subunit H